MKHTNKFIAILMAISILLSSINFTTSFAVDSNQTDGETEIEELQPVVASGCYSAGGYNFRMVLGNIL